MRILLVSDNYLPSLDGITSSVTSLAMGLRQLGHKVMIIAPDFRLTSPPKDLSVHYVRSVAAFNYHISLASPRTIRRVVQQFDPHVIHVHTAAIIGVAAAAFVRQSDIPVALTWHTDLLSYRSAYPALNAAIPILFAALETRTRPVSAWCQAALALLGTSIGRDVTDRHRKMLAAFIHHFDDIIVPSAKAATDIPVVGNKEQLHIIPSAPLPIRPITQLDADMADALRSAQARMPVGDRIIAGSSS